MENAVVNPPAVLPTLRSDDRAVFERVWRRVMPEGGGDIPILVEAGDAPLPCLCAEEEEPPHAPPRPQQMGHRESDFPGERAVSCAGTRLPRQIHAALESARLYQALARRSAGSGSGRALSGLSAGQYRAARRLAAAYFLITGIAFWPREGQELPPLSSYFGTIRSCYQQEERLAQTYLLEADSTGDEALAALYLDLAGQSRAHCQTLRAILEQSRL